MSATVERPTWRNATQAARFVCAMTNVAEPYEAVAADGFERGLPIGRRAAAAASTAWVIAHRRNRTEYLAVMG